MNSGAYGIDVTGEPERLGPYLLLDRIGAGGMAEGYLAVKHVGGDAPQKVFLKRILSEHRSDPDYVRWFQREAAIVASLRHANIVLLLDADPDGRYLAFELIDGLDLRHLLQSHPERRLPVDVSVLILTEVLKALEFAHSRTSGGAPAGVVHRDLDPSNVLISYAGEVKVADFGVAAVVRGDGEPLTSVVGKAHYRAPEETRNDGGLDGRSDLFSLGVLAYQMLSGERPYTGTRAEIARAIAAGRRISLQHLAPEVPAALAGIIERLMSPDPADRFASAAECHHAIYAAHQPDRMLYRELGRLALRARPHQTIETSRLRSLASRASVPNAGAPPEDASGSRLADSARSDMKALAGVEGGAPAARRVRSRVLQYVALSTGLVAIGLIIAATITSNDGSRPQARGLEAKPPIMAPPNPAPQPTTTVASPTPTTVASPQPVTVATPPRTTVASPPPRGAIRIGAVPQSQVWIDGRLVGWSPIIERVPAGRHTVSIGRDNREDPSTRRLVTVVPGRQQRVGF